MRNHSLITKGLTLMAALAVSIGANAAQVVKVTSSEGTTTEFELNDKPVINYNAEGNLQITAGEQQVTMPGDDTYTCTIGEATGIKSVAANTMRVSIHGTEIVISGLTEGTIATVYSLSGMQISQAQADTQGTAVLTADTKGSIAIINVNNQSFKIKL